MFAITNGLIFWQMDTALGAFDHILDMFVRTFVADAFFRAGVTDEYNDYPYGKTDEQDS